MQTILRTIGFLMWIGSGILMFIFWLLAMSNWLGIIGVILAFVLTPGLVIFPMVFWIIEGVFPVFYFIVWGLGILGIVIASVFSD